MCLLSSLVLMYYLTYVKHPKITLLVLHKWICLPLYSTHILAWKYFPPQSKLWHFTHLHVTQSLSDPICDSVFLWCYACWALTSSLCCLHTFLWWGQSLKLLQHAEGNLGGAKLSHSLLFLTEELKEQLEKNLFLSSWSNTITSADVSIWTEPLLY